MSARPLNAREREILRDIVMLHTTTAEPVSSRSLAKLQHHGLSAASIRNIMSDLEDGGFLRQPHASAGRVPTAFGYHFFVDALMQTRHVSAKERRMIDDRLMNKLADADELMGETSHLLSELTEQVSIVVAPDVSETVLRAIDFVPLSGSRILCIVVSETGFVDNKVIDAGQAISREDLIAASNYLTENFAGMDLRQIRDRLLALMADERSQMDRLLGLTIELARSGIDIERREVLVDGTTGVLRQPELADIERVKTLFETFSDRARVVRLLNQCMDGKGVRVLIGDESDLTSELDFSLVATRYGVGDRSLGTLGIFGPSRMKYDRIIPLVHHLGETLSIAFAHAIAEDQEQERLP